MNAAAWHALLAPLRPHLVDGRIVDCGDAAAEIAALAQRPLRTPCAGLGVVAVRGADARTFLHGQLSADLHALAAGQALHTAWCSPKGRVLFLLRVLADADGFILLLPAVQCAALVRRLRLYVLRAAVTVADLGASHGCILVNGDADLAVPVPATVTTASAGAQRWYVGPWADLAACWAALPMPVVGEAAAAIADIRHGIVTLDASLSDLFLPQELDLDRHAGVSFDKGCYPGQEIVARVRYRGSVKRRLARFRAALDQPLAAGTRLLAASDERARGTVLMSERAAPGTIELLAVTDLEAARLHPATHAACVLDRGVLPTDGEPGA